MSEGISLRDFGRQIGVTGEAVRKAIADGRIPKDCVGQRVVGAGKVWPVIIDARRAAQHWGKNADATQVRDKAVMSAGAKRGWQKRRGEDPGDDDLYDDDPPPDRQTGKGGGPSYNDIRKVTESYKAKLARLEYEEKSGKLVDAEAIAVAEVTMLTSLRNRLRGVPSEAKSRIPHLTIDEIEVLEELIDQALNDTADEDAENEE